MKDIQKQIIKYNFSARSSAPIYIVIHDTGDPGASAQNEHDYFSGGDRGASADYFVDSSNIIQIIDTDKVFSWAVGDGAGAYGITNRNSCSIEMCLDSNGNPTQETVQNTIDLTLYLMKKYGIDIDHVVRHYDASRKPCPGSFMANNWTKWNDFKSRLAAGGSLKSGSWVKDDTTGKWWYKYDAGSYATGWQKISDKWYLFDAKGWMLTGWQKDGDKWYYLTSDGPMKTGWLKDKDQWYFLNSEGVMAIGWMKVDDKWYFLNSEGVMRTGWIQDGNDKYYAGDDGALLTGWKQIGDDWYYFNLTSGAMAKSTIIDGYTINENGIYKK